MNAKNGFHDFFVKNGVPQKKVTFYIHWLNKFIKFYPRRLDRVTHRDILRFLDKLSREGAADWQMDQAGHAVSLYLEQYCGKKILSTDQPEMETNLISSQPTTWSDAKDLFV